MAKTEIDRVACTMWRSLDDGNVLVITALLPVTEEEGGTGYVVDLDGQDDLYLCGNTQDDAVEQAMDGLCQWADAYIAGDTREPILPGVTIQVEEARRWSRHRYPEPQCPEMVPA